MLGFRIISLIIVSTFLLFGQENELGANIGLNSIYNEDGIHFENTQVGITYQYNAINSPVKPRVDIDFVDVSDYHDGRVSSLVKGSINGVYEHTLEENSNIEPYMLVGAGYEKVNDEIDDVFEDHVFGQVGVGVNYKLNSGSKFKLEGKILQIFGGDNQDNEVMVSAGVSVPISGFGKDKCPIKISEPDEDRDGIRDSLDQCPQTPCYFTVNQYGCPVKATLKIHFAVDSATIRPHSMIKVKEFADFLLRNKGSQVKIEGHTDSDGSDSYNLLLSQRRAAAVVSKLIEFGVSSTRLSAIGYGESRPVASNATAKGKAENRRIVARISYPTQH